MHRRVAIVHDWLTSMRGSERVVEALLDLYPDADLFTLRHDAPRLSPRLSRQPVTTAFTDRLGGRFRALLPVFPFAIGRFRLEDYGLVISSSHCVALGAHAPRNALHVAYIHSPMRYIREAQPIYEAAVPGGAAGRLAFRAAAHLLRRWDTRAGARPDVMIANSSYTRERISRYYGRDAAVIPPPIDTARFERAAARARKTGDERPLLIVSALVPNKRLDLAVRAVTGRPERLIVVGEGPEAARLRKLAGGNVSFLGWVEETELEDLYAGCRALLHPAVDDFGMAMVEAMAAGRPVVASREGGARDVVVDGETGLFIESPTVVAVRAALDRLAVTPFEPARLMAHARAFDRAVFLRRFADTVAEAA